MSSESSVRRVLIVSHPRREDMPRLTRKVLDRLHVDGMRGVLLEDDVERLEVGDHPAVEVADPAAPAAGCELICVLGGDGTLLWGAELGRGSGVPLLGVNLGHVGFLAEAESSQIAQVVAVATDRSYQIESRLTIRVRVLSGPGGDVLWESFAVNEASLEKASRQRMLEAVVAIDDQPLSRWGCDGILVSTPTGSTAYSFSAGGPIAWPGVDAMLIVPLSAHALFNRPVVVPADTHVTVQVVEADYNLAVVWLDGRRSFDLQPGHVLEVTRGTHRLRLARIAPDDFTARLVRKFGLSVEGWRGAAERRRG